MGVYSIYTSADGKINLSLIQLELVISVFFLLSQNSLSCVFEFFRPLITEGGSVRHYLAFGLIMRQRFPAFLP